jgi:hypothetical protein
MSPRASQGKLTGFSFAALPTTDNEKYPTVSTLRPCRYWLAPPRFAFLSLKSKKYTPINYLTFSL